MKKWHVIVVGILLFTITSACAITQVQKFMPSTQVVAQAQVIATVDPNATNTSTPFQPIGPTPTHTITATPEITITPTLTEVIDTATPTPWFEDMNLPEGQINMMLIGNDYRPSSGFRTDTMVLVSINPKTKVVNALSFPRDLYVLIPGRGYNRLNVAMAFGGFYLLQQTLELNFQFKPDYYVMTNFQGFESIINTMGGIQVNVEKNLYDRCDLPTAINGYCSVGPGLVYMNGATALWYARSRSSTSDFDRNRRQQEVLLAMLNSFSSLDLITKAPALFETYRNTVETNLDLTTIIKLIPIIPSLKEPGHLNRFYIGPAQASNHITETGAWVLIPNQYAIQEIIKEVLYSQ